MIQRGIEQVLSKDITTQIDLLLESIRIELNLKFFQGTGLKHLQKPLFRDRLIYIPLA